MVLTFLILVATGCANNSKEQPVSAGPVTLKLYAHVGLTDAEFAKFYQESVAKKFPNITMELVKKQSGVSEEDLLSAGQFPDIVLTSNPNLEIFKKLDVIEPLDGLIKKYQEDLNRYDPEAINGVRKYSDKGEILALPYAMNYAVLYYNKDIFDKFGVAYPKDLMTWEEAVELERKLTRLDGGVQYIGLDPGPPEQLGAGKSMPYVDPKTNKSMVVTDGWKEIFNQLKSVYEVPGFVGANGKYTYGRNSFMKDKTLAMLADWGNGMTGPLEDMYTSGEQLNWDMAALPNFKENLGKSREVDLHLLFISKTSQHKDQAFQVISLINSNEVQTIINKSGRLSSLKKTDEFKTSYGTDLGSMKGKHIDAIFKTVPSPIHAQTEYDKIVKDKLKDAAAFIAKGTKDVNTALRDAQEESDKELADALGK